MKLPNHKVLNESFALGVAIKGLDGILELIGAFVLLMIKPGTINRLAEFLTQHELVRDPHDFIANHMLMTAQHFSNAKLFGVIYLFSHGIIKVVLAIALLRHRAWAYPATIGFLILFMLYQIYRIGYNHSIALTILTIFDALIVWLVWREYQLKKMA